MFDELVETKTSGDGKVTVKRHVTDEQDRSGVEMRKANDALNLPGKRRAKLDAKPRSNGRTPTLIRD